MAELIVSILIFCSVPALMPRWQHALYGAGFILAASVAAMIYVLRDLGANPSGVDGPAFATIIVIFGCVQAIVAASFVGPAIAYYVTYSLTPRTRIRVEKLLLVFSLLPLAIAGALVFLHLASRGLIALTIFVIFPLLWLALALQLAPNSSFKPSPHQGGA